MYENTDSIKKSSHGFTLIEVLVYVAVLVLVTGAAVVTYLSLDTTLMRNRAERMINHDAVASLEHITRAIRGSASVHMGLSTFDSSPGVLALTDGATTTRFSLSNGRLVLSVNGVVIGPLTSDDVTVSELVFTHYDNGDTELVRMSLTLSVNTKAASTTRTYYSSALVRNSYE